MLRIHFLAINSRQEQMGWNTHFCLPIIAPGSSGRLDSSVMGSTRSSSRWHHVACVVHLLQSYMFTLNQMWHNMMDKDGKTSLKYVFRATAWHETRFAALNLNIISSLWTITFSGRGCSSFQPYVFINITTYYPLLKKKNVCINGNEVEAALQLRAARLLPHARTGNVLIITPHHKLQPLKHTERTWIHFILFAKVPNRVLR